MPVLTRNQARKIVPLTVDIDFDGASRAWRANKRHIGMGYFLYTNKTDRRDDVCDQKSQPNRSQRNRRPPVRFDPSE